MRLETLVQLDAIAIKALEQRIRLPVHPVENRACLILQPLHTASQIGPEGLFSFQSGGFESSGSLLRSPTNGACRGLRVSGHHLALVVKGLEQLAAALCGGGFGFLTQQRQRALSEICQLVLGFVDQHGA